MTITGELIPVGMLIIFIGGLIAANREVSKRPTYKEMEEKYTEQKVCKAEMNSLIEKVECLPEIKKTVIQIETKIDILLNGK
jgi:Tfp pilus assembly protein PilO